MSDAGYNGRAMTVDLDSTKIAAIQSSTTTHNRTAVDVTTGDSDSWRRLLPNPATRSIDEAIDGVVTENNLSVLRDVWAGNLLSNITINYPDGSTASAEDGFFLGNLDFTGAHDGAVTFTATLQSSGAVTVTPAA